MKLLKVEIETRECVQTKGSNRGTFSLEKKRPNYGKNNPRLQQPYTLQKAQETHLIAHIAVENILQPIVMWSQIYKKGKYPETCRQVLSLFTKVRAHSPRL